MDHPILSKAAVVYAPEKLTDRVTGPYRDRPDSADARRLREVRASILPLLPSFS
jgi:hypothetical protein